MESVKSYLVLSFMTWCEDHSLTPMLAIRTHGSILPDFLYRHEQINLNISVKACLYFKIEDGVVLLTARFNGESFDIKIPIQNLILIFSKEDESILDLESVHEGCSIGPIANKKANKKSHMKVIWNAKCEQKSN